MLTNQESKQSSIIHLIIYIGFVLLLNIFAFIYVLDDANIQIKESKIIALIIIILLHLIFLICLQSKKHQYNHLLILVALSIQIIQNELGLLLIEYQKISFGFIYQFISGQFIFFFKLSIFQFQPAKQSLIAQIALYLYYSFRTIYSNQQFNYVQIVSETFIFIPISLPFFHEFYKKMISSSRSNSDKLFASILSEVKEGVIIFDQRSNLVFKNKIIDQQLGHLDDEFLNLKLQIPSRQWTETLAKEYITNNDQHLISFQNSRKPLRELPTLREAIELILEQSSIVEYEDVTFKQATFHLVLSQSTINNKRYSVLRLDFQKNYKFLDESSKEKQFTQQAIISQAKLCHEIKNPLNAIIAMLEYIEDTSDENDYSQYISSCLQSAKLLSSLLSDLQDKAQISKKKFLANYTTFDINTLLKELIVMFQFQTQKKLILLEYKIESGIQNITSDENRLRQILINLISNSIKFTPPSGTIQIFVNRSGQNLIRLSVKDSGIGISEENLKNLFEDFGKINETNHLNFQGVGLGLSISQEIALKLGPEGDKGIQVSSEKGRGSEFYFLIINMLPDENLVSEDFVSENEIMMKENNFDKISEFLGKKRFKSQMNFQNGSSKKIPSIKNINGNIYRKPQRTTIINTFINKQESGVLSRVFVDLQNEVKVLIVDDEPFNLQAFESILQLFGIKSDTAMSGMQAIKLVKEKTEKQDFYKLIFMDFEMPEMDGLSTSRSIAKITEQQEKKTFIIGCTGYSNVIFAADAGINEVLEKPVTKKKVQNILKRFCRSGN